MSTEGPAPDSVNDSLQKKIQEILPDEEKREELLTTIRASSESWIGPLPPPRLLEQYNKILPGLAERIVSLTEEQSKHRQHREKTVVESQVKESYRGQLFGLLIGISGLAISLVLALQGHDTVAGIIGSGTLVSLVTVFVLGGKKQTKELKEKSEGN